MRQNFIKPLSEISPAPHKNYMYPAVKDVNLVGTYPASVKSGGGFVWDDVLEYRVFVPAGSAKGDPAYGVCGKRNG